MFEERMNLVKHYNEEPVKLSSPNMIFRMALMASLGNAKIERNVTMVEDIKLKDHIHDSCFNWQALTGLWSALLKLRWNDKDIDWSNKGLKDRIINWEILQGIKILMKDGEVDRWMSYVPSSGSSGGAIPKLLLEIGEYEGEILAKLDMNSRAVPNTQVLVAGATGSGKSNLLAVLIHEMRTLSVESSYPVNFLLFDYKGEFSDPANSNWLDLFSVDNSCILRPVEAPLPFSPFKDFTGKTQNEINLYATELAQALCAIDKASISARMSDRLTEAVIESYNITDGKPIHFDVISDCYTDLQDKDMVDSVRAVLNQLIRANLFAREDKINLIDESLIIKMDDFPKDGPVAKAIVYFIISKLNTLYEMLPKQATDSNYVELRHFTIIDEAHYMLDFDNKPLRDLIATGRNKGLSIILATQNMASYKSEYFDFYANAQYPLIMKQQTIADGVVRDLFGVSGNEFQEIKEAISKLKKGELIIKDSSADLLGLGKKYKKIKVRHLI
jgi:hypothetical protein